MTAHILGSYTFDYNPDKLTIPETKKQVSEVKTYTGSAIFQWDDLIQGEKIIMFWKTMSATQYGFLRTLYLSTVSVVWNPQAAVTYNVIVTDLKGKYIDFSLNDLAYRESVELTLSIRSVV